MDRQPTYLAATRIGENCGRGVGGDGGYRARCGEVHESGDAPQVPAPVSGTSLNREGGEEMILLGVVLLLIGLIAGIGILWVVGVVLVLVGLALAALGAMGRAVGGRRHYY
jgi:hypothetical protein